MTTKRLSKDRISNLPSTVIESILCLVPIQDATRTSILSKEWRYKWTKIPKIVFDKDTFQVSIGENQLSVLEKTIDVSLNAKSMFHRCRFFYAIYQVLLLHRGPVLDFTLSIEDVKITCVEIDQIICYLSKNNTVKSLSLYLNDSSLYRVPLSLFSLHQLTDLNLRGCSLEHEPAFNGFGSLTNLYLNDVHITTKSLVHLLSSCPLLKSFTLFTWDGYSILDGGDSDIIKLFKCLPLIEHLTLSGMVTECFGLVPKKLSTYLLHLKYLCLQDFCFIDHYGLFFLALLIRSSPNLEKIKLEIADETDFGGDDYVALENYSDIWLEHLNEIEIEGFHNSEHQFEVVKFILAKSPVLKKMRIVFLSWMVTKDQELEMLRTLLCSPRASPLVNIFVERGKH